MLFKKALPYLDSALLLDAVPSRNGAVRTELRNETLILWVPLEQRFFMKAPWSWVLPFRKEKGIELDPLGREVFEECDGERTLEQIIERFSERHRVRFHEARASVAAFLNSLLARKVMVVRVPKEAIVHESPSKRSRKRRKEKAP